MTSTLPDAAAPWRIAMLDPADFTPAYDQALADALRADGQDVVLIGSFGGGETNRPAYRRDHFYRGLMHPLARAMPRRLRRPLKGLHHALDLAHLVPRVIRDFEPSVIHVQWLPLPLADRLVVPGLRRHAPLVITLHDSNPYNGAASALMRWGYLAVLASADAVIVHTAQARERLAAAGIPTQRLHCIAHGLLHPPGHTGQHRHVGGRLQLLLFGKIQAYKGVEVILQALALLSPAERDLVRLRVVGRPYMDVAPFVAFVRDHGLGDVVQFRFEFVPETEIGRLFQDADAACFPYHGIDASGAAMTAIAHGVPVLASDVGGFGELLRDGREARLVPAGDAPALAAVIREWVRAPHSLVALATGMRVRRAAVPSWRSIAMRTKQAYALARERWLSERARSRTGPLAAIRWERPS